MGLCFHCCSFESFSPKQESPNSLQSPKTKGFLPAAETAIWLDLPFLTVYRRLAWRTITRSITHGELWNGNRETLRQTFLTGDSMLVWGIKSWRPHRRSLIESLYTDPPAARVYRLRTPGQVRYLLANAQAATAAR